MLSVPLRRKWVGLLPRGQAIGGESSSRSVPVTHLLQSSLLRPLCDLSISLFLAHLEGRVSQFGLLSLQPSEIVLLLGPGGYEISGVLLSVLFR